MRPIGLKRFRLEAEAFVDWKSHPYRDIEVVEWYRRIEFAKRVYREVGRGDCQTLCALARRHHLSHLVSARASSTSGSCLQRLYGDSGYVVFLIACQEPGAGQL